MSYKYEPEIEEEEDGGYSIPKILVAVLLLIVIGAGAYIYYQQKKITNSIAYLLNSKKQLEQDLNEMIEKYNLAINDNDFLADELRAERDRIIKYRDSIKNVKGEDFGKLKTYEQTIRNLKKNSAIVFNDTPILTAPPSEEVTIPTEEEEEEEEKETTATTEETTPPKEKTPPKKKTPPKEKTPPKQEKAPVVPDEKTNKEEPVKKIEESKPETVAKTTNFVRVETPPTYPGCKGNAAEKKACFTKKVKRFVGRKFNADIISGYDIPSGEKRIWVSFDIDKYGNITNVNARPPKGLSASASAALKKEAERVVQKLPKMVAARQNGNPLKINYSVPIIFIVP